MSRVILDKFANADWETSEGLCKECAPRPAAMRGGFLKSIGMSERADGLFQLALECSKPCSRDLCHRSGEAVASTGLG